MTRFEFDEKPVASFARRRLRDAALALLASVLVSCSTVDAMKRVEVDFEYVSQRASELAQRQYRPPEPLPPPLQGLSYDDFQRISAPGDRFLWRSEGLPFAVGFFHLGYLFNERVRMNEFTATHEQPIRYMRSMFEFHDKELEAALPATLDYAGMRITTNLDNRSHYPEVASFLGASYFRAVGFDHRYGTSARGIAIDSGLSTEEEFPRFSEFWLGKPLGNSPDLVIYALLEGPSLTGAYRFVIKPGNDTVMEVKSRLFLRDNVKSFGVAPLTSMFWRGENRTSPETDYRPEVHDSDGLLVKERGKDPIWRPLDLGTSTRLSYFGVQNLDGYGLMQRDRHFENYQDMEAHYHERPSVWIQAKGDWGAGFIRLVELPTGDEFHDNIVAFWEPVVLPERGAQLDFEYDIHWTSQGGPEGHPQERVIATRIGQDQSYPGTHVFVLDFTAGEGRGEEVQPPQVDANVGEPSALVGSHVAWNPYAKAWRVTLRVNTPEEGAGAVELSCQLRFEDEAVSEVWSYQWTR